MELRKETNLYNDDAIQNGMDTVATQKAQQAVSALDQEAVFNKLTNNGSAQGIFLRNGQLYINMTYLQTGTLKVGGFNNYDGLVEVYNSSNYLIFKIDESGLNHYSDRFLDREDRVHIHDGYIEGYMKSSVDSSWTKVCTLDLSNPFIVDSSTYNALHICAESGSYLHLATVNRDMHFDSGRKIFINAKNVFELYSDNNIQIWAGGTGDLSNLNNNHDILMYGKKAYMNGATIVTSVPRNGSSNVDTSIDYMYYSPGSSAGGVYMPPTIAFIAYNGSAYFVDIDTSSDERLKRNIRRSGINALEAIKQVEFFEFDYSEENVHKNIGYVAQQLEKIIPEAVYETPHLLDKRRKASHNTKHINYNEIIIYATKAIQELSRKIETIESQINQ